MEGRSSFKECPRCGLRNRMSATKCDFCGYEFKGSSEEWSDYVDILEKLSKGDEVRPVDEDLSKKIESTLVKKRDIDEVMVKSSVAAAGVAVVGDKKSAEEDQIITEADQPKEVVDFVDSMIDEDASEPISGGEVESVVEIESSEEASLEYFEEPISDEQEAGLEAKVSEVDRTPDWAETAAAAALAAEMAEPKELGPEIQEYPTKDVPGFEEELVTDEVHGVDVEQEAAEIPAFHEEISVEEETIGGLIPVGIEEPVPAEVREISPEPAEAAMPESFTMEEGIVGERTAEGTDVTSSPTPALPFAASLGVGAVVYLVAIGGFLFLSLDAALVWALVILGSMMMLFGFRRFYDVFLPVSEARKRNTGQ